MQNNLPAPVSPLNNIMVNGMPNLPQIIQDAMPAPLPPMEYDTGVLGMILGTYKRKKIAQAKEWEAQIAENSLRITKAKTGAIIELVTMSQTIEDKFDDYRHQKEMRVLEERKEQAEIRLLETEEKKREAEMQKIQYETALIGNEVKLGNIEFQIRERDYKRILEEG